MSGIVLLALDPADFVQLENAAQVIEPGCKHPANPVLRPRPGEWDGTRCKVYGTVLYDPSDGVFKMWYSGCADTPDAVRRREGTTRSVGYAVSSDGVRWERPELGLLEYNGSTANNLVLRDAQAPSVFLQPDAAPVKRYMMFTEAGLDTARNHLLYSADGIRWVMGEREPVTSYIGNRIHEPFSLVYDPDDPDPMRRWKGYSLLHPTENGYRGRAVGLFTGPDPEMWTEHAVQPILSAFDGLESEIHLPFVMRQHGRFIMLYDAMEPNHHTQTEIAISRNGLRFERIQNGVKLLANGPPGEPDAGCICIAPRACFVHDGRIWCYYTMSADTYQTAPRNFHATPWYRYTGLAQWREDGFASLRPMDQRQRGVLTTRVFAGGSGGLGRLHLNAVSGPADGGIVIAAIGYDGRERARSLPWRGDALRGEVSWEGGAPAISPHESIALRITLAGDARVYAVYLEDVPAATRRDAPAPARRAVSPGTSGRRVQWTFRAGAKVSASPVLRDGTLYVGSWDHRFYAIDAVTGEERWRYQAGNAITASAAVDQDRVYVGSHDGHMVALHRDTGREAWRLTSGAWFDAPPALGVWANRWGDEREDPTRLFVGCHNRSLYAIDPTSGGICWQYPTFNWVLSRPAIANYTVYGASLDGLIYALDARCGGTVWTHRIGRHLQYAPAVVEGSVCVEAVSGALLAAGDTVYCGGDDGFVVALDARTGEERWHYRTGAAVQGGPALVAGVLITGAVDGSVYGLSAETGERLWRFDGRSPVYSEMVPGPAGDVLVAASGGQMFAIDPCTGVERWRFDVGEPLRAAPAISGDGMIYLTTVGGAILALQ